MCAIAALQHQHQLHFQIQNNCARWLSISHVVSFSHSLYVCDECWLCVRASKLAPFRFSHHDEHHTIMYGKPLTHINIQSLSELTSLHACNLHLNPVGFYKSFLWFELLPFYLEWKNWNKSKPNNWLANNTSSFWIQRDPQNPTAATTIN